MSTDLQTTSEGSITELKQADWHTPTSTEQAFKMAQTIAKSDLAPKDFKGKPESVLIAMQMGAEVGLSPMQAIQNIAVINGRPCLWGDAMLALVMKRKDFAGIEENQTATEATCTVKRVINDETLTFSQKFTKEDAVTAGLWGSNVWKKYPRRMLQMRARGFALRDAFADALRGINVAEEVRDYKDVTSISTVKRSQADIASKLGITITKPEQEKKAEAQSAVKEKASKLDRLIDDNNLQALRAKWLDAKKLSHFEEFSEQALDYCIDQVERHLEKKAKEPEQQSPDKFYDQWDEDMKESPE